MNLFESIRLAWTSLLSNKLRSSLTMLGIVIGIFAVIVLISIGRGLEKIVNEQFNSIGSNLLFVFPITPGETAQGARPPSSRGSKGLSADDIAALEDVTRAPDVRQIAPVVTGRATVTFGREDTDTSVQGVTASYQTVRNTNPALGAFVSENDVVSESRVAVLGQSVVDKLFTESQNPIGANIRINDVPFRVIGVLEKKGGGSFGDQDDIVLVPLSVAQNRLFERRNAQGKFLVDVIFVQAVTEEQMDAAALEITNVLRDQHGVRFREEDDFQVITQKEILSAAGQITGAVTIFLGIIAAISLLVGGIGIMNIMLVSVTERTREIGLRKAVGAKRRDILVQFLIESTFLAVVGGILGTILGAAGAKLAELLVPDLTTVVSLDIIVLATAVSAAIGMFFGIYPAYRAAGLNPIDALRYE